jgi:P27 family predicted phage terminase small subunit
MRGPVKQAHVRRQTLGDPSKNSTRYRAEAEPIVAARPKTVPKPPEGLTGTARAEWIRVAAGLHASGLLAILDLSALEDYCRLYAIHQDLHADIARSGVILKPGVINPNVKVASKISDQLQKLRESLGLSPAARARLSGRIAPVKKPMTSTRF